MMDDELFRILHGRDTVEHGNTVHYEVWVANGKEKESRDEMMALLDEVEGLQDYVFHCERFDLGVKGAGCLHGQVLVEDCVMDEWFVVRALKVLSERFDCLANVWDDDGQFLLMEAAEEIPEWLEPSTAEGRVWIFRGKLHIVGPSLLSIRDAEEARSHAGEKCRGLIRAKPEKTVAAEPVQEAIWRRTDRNTIWQDNEHRFTCYLPEKCIKVLGKDPGLVPKAVRSFFRKISSTFGGDPSESLRPHHFPLDEAFHPFQVRFTRLTYSMLRRIPFEIPGQYKTYFKTKLDGVDSFDEDENEEFRRIAVGVKLIAGLEWLFENKALEVSQENVGIAKKPEKVDDSENWMYLDQTELEELLSKRNTQDMTEGLEETVDSVKEFFQTDSTLDGADPSLQEASLDVERMLELLQTGFTSFEQNFDDEESDEYDDMDMEAELRKEPALRELFPNKNDEDEVKPVDIDLNLVDNLLKSISMEEGAPGPASTLLNMLREKEI